MKEYKRKYHPKWWSWNESPKEIKKSINSSERQRGKQEVRNQVQELHNQPDLDHFEQLNREAEWYYNSTPCAECLLSYAKLDKLAQTFMRLGIIVITDYERDNYSCEHKQSPFPE